MLEFFVTVIVGVAVVVAIADVVAVSSNQFIIKCLLAELTAMQNVHRLIVSNCMGKRFAKSHLFTIIKDNDEKQNLEALAKSEHNTLPRIHSHSHISIRQKQNVQNEFGARE